jgi:hypothetical protein
MKFFILPFVIICLLGCSRNHENKNVPTPESIKLKNLMQTQTQNKIKTFKIDSTLVSQCEVTNVDTDFVRLNLFNIDNDYWKYYSKYSTKYITIHLIDTIQKYNNTLFITFFESYRPPNHSPCGPYYAIKLMIVEDDVAISVNLLAEHQNYQLGGTSLSSYVLPGNKIITNEESFGCSDMIGEDGKMDCQTIFRTKYLFYNNKNKRFNVLMETVKIKKL